MLGPHPDVMNQKSGWGQCVLTSPPGASMHSKVQEVLN